MINRSFFRRILTSGILVLFLMITFSGCSKSNNVTVGKKAPQETKKEIQAKKSSNLYMVREMNMADEMITLQALDYDQAVMRYPYSLATKFMNQYGDSTSWNSFFPGRVVKIGDRLRDKTLSSVQLADEVWEQEDIKKYNLDIDKNMLTVGSTKYRISDNTAVFSNDQIASIADIGSEDTLRVVGKDKNVISVSVVTGHGTIKLMNTDLFNDSMVAIGSGMFTNISGEGMEIEMPEGDYKLTVANNGYGGSKDVSVKRGETTIVDLNELKGEGPKSCDITFHVAVDGAKIYLDGNEMNKDEIHKVTYGKHVLMVQAEGYNTWQKTLYVNSPKADITLDLSDENETSENSNSTSNSSSSSKNSESTSDSSSNKSSNNSTTNHNSSSQNSNNNGTNYGGTSNNNSTNVRNTTNTDYLQTMQDALSSLLKTD